MKNKRFPHYKQLDVSDCGPTSLRMIAQHYWLDYSTEKLRKHCHITRYERIAKQNFESIHTPEIEEEMKKHAAWRRKTSLVATPTVLVNGHIIPDEYGLEDLAMITNVYIREKNILQNINGRSTTPLGADQLSAEETV